jgi:hypothetical protein
VERQPALTLTPARLRTEIDAAARAAASTASRPFVEAVHQVQSAARDLAALAGRVRERREQRMWLLTTGALGLMVGAGLWYVTGGLLPRRAGDWIAASLIGGSKWQAGETLVQESSPESWARMVRLYDGCGAQTTELCEAAIAVRTVPSGQEGGRGAPAPAPSHSLPRGRRTGEQDQ